MDSNRIKQVALGARTTLMQEVDAALDRVLAPDSAERVAHGQAVSTIERTVADRGREAVVEQVAYTWFNRLCALRYMDVRGYTPVGLVSPRSGETLPAVLADARRGVYSAALGITQRDKDAINAMLNGETSERDPLGRAYVMLLVAACKAYEKSMDYLFGAGRNLGPAFELMAPTDLLSEGSLLQRICNGLDDTTCNEGVEVMGWLYQFYVSERKDAFFASKKKATAADIAPATQLFTPNWIVRYLVENSLGRLWMLNFPDSELKKHMDYYVEPEEPEEDFLKIYSPEDITFLDPACGSGHILVYAFDLLYLMYEEEGYRPTDIPELILKNNLTGIEIDDRAAEIASFCLEMKALERDGEFLNKDVDASIIATYSFEPSTEERTLIPKLCADTAFMNVAEHLNEIGSLYKPDNRVTHLLQTALSDVSEDGSFAASTLRNRLSDLKRAVDVLGSSYAVVATNPPYMNSGNANPWLSSWLKDNYPDAKTDLCTCFIERSIQAVIGGGYAGLVTMHSWMFLSSYERMRGSIIRNRGIATMAHLGTHAFDAIGGEVVSTSATIFTANIITTSGQYYRLVDYDNGDEKALALRNAIKDFTHPITYSRKITSFSNIPGSPIAYWASDTLLGLFGAHESLAEHGRFLNGMSTGKNEAVVRHWYEIARANIMLHATSEQDFWSSGSRYAPYNKGGEFRKWYGNQSFVLAYDRAANDYMDTLVGHRHNNPDTYFHRCLTWSKVSSGTLGMRYIPDGFVYDVAGCSLYLRDEDEMYYVLGLFNSSFLMKCLEFFSPTMNFEAGQIRKAPYIAADKAESDEINERVENSIAHAKEDWDAFETSWDFTWHPLAPSHREWLAQHNAGINAEKRRRVAGLIEERYGQWEKDCRYRFDRLKANEEELNRIFAHIYGMEGEVPIEVPDDKISVRLADLGRDIRSLVSYGVGCMFGRYSLDEPGLILADEGSTLDDYLAKVPNPSFEPDRTGIIPITDADTEWFEDDIVAQFRRWLAAAYGQDTLDENVAFIENALGKTLRAYFVRDFYDDHLKTYQKRPIYWLFQSPKKGLSALVYLHRYNPNTVTTLLTEYVRPLREQMDAQARLLEVTGNARDASTATKYRATIEELDKWEHDVIFPLSQKHVALDLDDGVKANYGKAEFKGALRKVTGLN